MTVSLSNVNAPTVGPLYRLRRIARVIAGKDREERRAAKEFEADQDFGRKSRRSQSIHDHYNDDVDVRAFYKTQADFRGDGPRRVSSVRLAITRDAIRNVLRSDPSVKSVVDFGCHYGWLANEIATEFPHISVVSTDRSQQMMALNRSEFPRANILFSAVPDMAEFIRQEPQHFKDAVFTHTHTTMFLLPEAVREIYDMIQKAGTLYIAAHEQLGFSRHSLRQFQFSYEPRRSMWHRDGILLHNYPELMRTAGFELTAATAHRAPVPQVDWRTALFIAKRGLNDSPL